MSLQDKTCENCDDTSNECETEFVNAWSMSKAIENQFLNENTSDMVLIVEEQRFYVHKIILSARSEYFHALFYGDLKESKQTEVELNETSVEPFYLFLKIVYSSKINLRDFKEETIMGTLELARRYMIEDLEKGICQYLRKIMNVANISIILDHAIMFQMKKLIDDCNNFAEDNAKEILGEKSFLTLSATTLIHILTRDSFYAEEIAIFRAVQKWIKRNQPENAENIVCHIRLPLIAMHYLVKEVRSSNLFSDSALLSAIDIGTHGKYEQLNYRKFKIVGENFASEIYGAKVISGSEPQLLLDGNSTVYDDHHGYTSHRIEDDKGITIELKKPYGINSIRMLLWDLDDRFYSYYINVSEDGCKWSRIIDNRDKKCKSWQELIFPPRTAKLIRIVGTRNSENLSFHVISFECSFKDKLEEK